MKKKIRKPAKIHLQESVSVQINGDNLDYPIRFGTFIGPIRLRLQPAKHLHKWLGKAIE